MGRFVNPNNEAFKMALNSEIYVDKTNLISYTNSILNSENAFICNSRPRRFGKSITANMLAAYYSKGADSFEMFSNLQIAKQHSFKTYLNHFDVIHIDVQNMINFDEPIDNFVSKIQSSILNELKDEYNDIINDSILSLTDALSIINDKTGNKFVIIIDEWDVLIRDNTIKENIQKDYINFLRSLFKGIEPTRYIALAYLTGILPIIREKAQSALNNFNEFTMLSSDEITPYIGFNENEVQQLCLKYNHDYSDVKRWYDGYLLNDQHIYNPKAVVRVMATGKFRSYWSDTSTFEVIKPLINGGFPGLKEAILDILFGKKVEVDVTLYQNNLSFKNKDDVLTYLIHLGYLAYNQEDSTAYYPNEEVRLELLKAIKTSQWSEYNQFYNYSLDLLNATLNKDNLKVCSAIEHIHDTYVSSIQYNNENSLSCVLSIAYLASMEYYQTPIREFPTGKGFVDYIFIPKALYAQNFPALLVELKWNKNVKTALDQIKTKDYPKAIQPYCNNILLVAISYNKEDKKHTCLIEEYSHNN